MIECFNRKMYDMFTAILDSKSSNIKITNSYQLIFEPNEKYRKIDLPVGKEPVFHSNYLDYFWAEFTYKNENYKVSMFYKNFDCGTGNLHVLPGAIQFWKSTEEKCGSIDEDALKVQHGCITYKEYGWIPITNEPLFF